MKNKIIILAIALSMLMILPMVNAEGELPFQVNKAYDYKFQCVDGVPTNGCDCTLSVKNVDKTLLVNEVVATESGMWYNVSFTPTQNGNIEITESCQKGTKVGSVTKTFPVTPSGNSGSSNMAFVILVFLLIYGVAFVGFFGKNEWVTMLGGMAMIGLGIYTINSGIIIYQDEITKFISWTTIGLGAFFTLFTGVSIIQETYN